MPNGHIDLPAVGGRLAPNALRDPPIAAAAAALGLALDQRMVVLTGGCATGQVAAGQ